MKKISATEKLDEVLKIKDVIYKYTQWKMEIDEKERVLKIMHHREYYLAISFSELISCKKEYKTYYAFVLHVNNSVQEHIKSFTPLLLEQFYELESE